MEQLTKQKDDAQILVSKAESAYHAFQVERGRSALATRLIPTFGVFKEFDGTISYVNTLL